MDIFKVSASALEAHRVRMNTIASNMANAQSTRTDRGGPYVKKNVVFKVMPVKSGPNKGLEGVRVAGIVEDGKPGTQGEVSPAAGTEVRVKEGD